MLLQGGLTVMTYPSFAVYAKRASLATCPRCNIHWLY